MTTLTSLETKGIFAFRGRNELSDVYKLEKLIDGLSNGEKVEGLLDATLKRLFDAGQKQMRTLFRYTSHIPQTVAERLVKLLVRSELNMEDNLKLQISKIARLFSQVVAHKLAWQTRGIADEPRKKIVQMLAIARKLAPGDQLFLRYNLKCAKGAWQSTEGGLELAKKYIKLNVRGIGDGIQQMAIGRFPSGLIDPLINAIKLAHSLKRKEWYHPSFRLHLRRILYIDGHYTFAKMFQNLPRNWHKDHSIAFAALEAVDTMYKQPGLTTEQKKQLMDGDEHGFPGYKYFAEFSEERSIRGSKRELGWKVRFVAVHHLIKFFESKEENAGDCAELLKDRFVIDGKFKEPNSLVRLSIFQFYKKYRKDLKWNITRSVTKKSREKLKEKFDKLSKKQTVCRLQSGNPFDSDDLSDSEDPDEIDNQIEAVNQERMDMKELDEFLKEKE